MGPGWLTARVFWEIHFKVCFSRLINLQAPVSSLGAVSTPDEKQQGKGTFILAKLISIDVHLLMAQLSFNVSMA